MPTQHFDLTQRPPRSVRTPLGGFVLLPRILDKCRALIHGKNGEYKYPAPIDNHFFTFTGLNPDDFRKAVETGKGDQEMLDWVIENSPNKLRADEILTWSAYMAQRAPMDTESRAFFNERHKEFGEARKDITTWFDLLDLDDYTTFGGKA